MNVQLAFKIAFVSVGALSLIGTILYSKFLFSLKNKVFEPQHQPLQHDTKQEKQLQDKIQLLQVVYDQLLQDVRSQQQATKTHNLPHNLIPVLDIYENSSIKIQTEILEDVIRMKFTEEAEIFNYIENQRLYWKLENSKKPYMKIK